MTKLQRVNIFSLAMLQGKLAALIGVAAGAIYSFGGFLADVLVSVGLLSPVLAGTPGLSFGTVLAFGALIGMPLIFGTLGLIVGLIEALLFNMLAKFVGGIEVELKE